MASKFRARVGESLATVQQHDVPLEEATTSSLQALQAYSMGWKRNASAGAEAALPFFKRAVEIDPKFALGYAALGLFYGSTGESDLAAENTRKAYELRDRASDKEKFFITAYYDGRATGNQEKAQQTCEQWAQIYPRDWTPHSFLSGFGLVWTTEKRLGLILLSLSMSGSLLFGLYHHFMVMGPDHVRSQPPNPWGLAFVLTAYGLSIAEAIGTYVGVHFLWIARAPSNRVV